MKPKPLFLQALVYAYFGVFFWGHWSSGCFHCLIAGQRSYCS